MISESLLHFAQYDLQTIALGWMAVLYTLKVIQLSRLPMPWERAPRKGMASRGILRSYAAIFMPWAMESTRQHPWRWVEFAVYHLGALAAIAATFTLPFAPGIMTQPVRIGFAVPMAAAVALGLVKLGRRVSRPEMRLISTPDDYFSLVTLEFFFGAGVLSLALNTPLWNLVYFLSTAGFLFYVPFSKISHYVYFFFAGLVTGSRYGVRGIRPQTGRAA